LIGMPNLRRAAAAPLIAVLLPAVLAGQSYFLGVSGGTAAPLAPAYAKSYLQPAGGPGFHLLYRMTGRIACTFDFCFHDFRLDGKRFLEDKGGDAASVTGSMNLDIVSIGLAGFANSIEDPVSLYGIAGMGFYRLNPRDTWLVSRSVDEFGETTSDTSLVDLGGLRNRFALNAGLGANLRLFERFGVFVEARYHWIFMRTQEDPVTLRKVRGEMKVLSPRVGVRLSF
jgi:hypothetical protein